MRLILAITISLLAANFALPKDFASERFGHADVKEWLSTELTEKELFAAFGHFHLDMVAYESTDPLYLKTEENFATTFSYVYFLEEHQDRIFKVMEEVKVDDSLQLPDSSIRFRFTEGRFIDAYFTVKNPDKIVFILPNEREQNKAVDTTAANAHLFQIDHSESTKPDVEAITEAAVVSP